MQWSWPLSGNHSKNRERRKMIKWDLIPRPLSLGTEPVLLVKKLEAVNPVFRTGPLNFLPLILIAASLGSSKAFLTGYCFSLQLGWYLNPTAQPSRSSLFGSGLRGHSVPFFPMSVLACSSQQVLRDWVESLVPCAGLWLREPPIHVVIFAAVEEQSGEGRRLERWELLLLSNLPTQSTVKETSELNVVPL